MGEQEEKVSTKQEEKYSFTVEFTKDGVRSNRNVVSPEGEGKLQAQNILQVVALLFKEMTDLSKFIKNTQ